MNVVIVGAGAVGQVFGRHLQRGGAQVTFFVRRPDALANGLVLHPLNEKPPRDGLLWTDYQVETQLDSPAVHAADVVLFTVPSPALHAPGFVAGFAKAAPLATFAGIQPGPHDATLVRQEVGEGQVVWGMFSLMSFSTEAVDIKATRHGIAYWRPPGAALGFTGEAARVAALVDMLTRGGLPAKQSRDFVSELAVGDAVLSAHTMALQAAGWSFQALRKDGALLRVANDACRELLRLSERRVGANVPFFARWLGPFTSRLLLRFAPLLAPFSFEQFFRAHYSKVATQTMALLEENRQLAGELRLPHGALDALRSRLLALEAGHSAGQ